MQESLALQDDRTRGLFNTGLFAIQSEMFRQSNVRLGSFINYVDRILSFFDDPPTPSRQSRHFGLFFCYIYTSHADI